MSNARIQFTLRHAAAFTVWLAAVFAAAHYALRLPLLFGLALVLAAAGVSYLIVGLGFTWLNPRETRRNSMWPSPLLLDGACLLVLVAAGLLPTIAMVGVFRAFSWALSLILVPLGATVAVTVCLVLSSHLMQGRRRARAARQRLRQMLCEGRALLDEPLPDEAAFFRWQRQVADWRAECERLLTAWLPARDVSDIFARSDVTSVWLQRLSPEHEILLGDLNAWLDRLRVIVASSFDRDRRPRRGHTP